MKLVVHPNPILRAHAIPVERVGKKERRLLKQMLKHMRRWKGIGLAAPQVACLEQLIVAEVNGQAVLWANPRILEGSGEARMEEGCLSVPATFVNVERSAFIWVEALDMEGRAVELKIEGLLARVVQHEIDHLEGVLIIDHGLVMQRQPSAGGELKKSGVLPEDAERVIRPGTILFGERAS